MSVYPGERANTVAMDIDVRTDRTGTVTLVSVVVRNPDPAPRRFRLTNHLAGPLWPPRVHGVPAAGWDDDGFEGVVRGDATQALGYASPTEPPTDEPPAGIAWTEPAGDSEVGPTAAGVVREFGDPRPPVDVVVPGYLRGEVPAARDDAADPAGSEERGERP
ncbi:MAG: hypothetical protein ABEJ67_05480 [Halanaeroarchaeum sp.]